MGRLIAPAVVLSLLAGVGAVACGGKSSAPPQSAPAVSALDAPAPVSGVRARIDPNAELLVYLDARGFRNSPFFEVIEHGISFVPAANAGLAQLTAQCGFDPVQSIEEVAVSVGRANHQSFDEDSVLVVAQFTAPPERVLDCIASYAPGASMTQLEGQRALELPDDGGVIVGDGSLLLSGTRPRLVRALSEQPVAGPPLDAGTYLQVRASALQAFSLNRATFSVRGLSVGTRFSFVDEAPSAETAARTKSALQKLQEQAKHNFMKMAQTPEALRYASGLLDSLVIESNGTTTSATLNLPDAEAEAAFTAMLVGLAIHGVRTYAAQEQVAEARVMLPRIAQGLATHAASKAIPRFPPSAPRTPKDVPARTKFTSDAKTWSHPSWKAIGFQIKDPQLYSYEYETAPDGKRATVRAHGDLDGDGVTSRFELSVEITAAGEIVIGPEMTTDKPLE